MEEQKIFSGITNRLLFRHFPSLGSAAQAAAVFNGRLTLR